MSAKFFALLTVIGANKLAKATALGTTLKITKMAVGDGGGTLPMPSAEQTKLVNEKRRAGINTLFVDSKNANQIVAEQVIPESEGGYWIREIGLFDDEGSLIAVGNCPETYKPQLQEGSGRTQTIRMILIVSHAESVELKVDPSVVLATREFVDNAIETASKSILDTVKKEYATKEEVKKKFDISNVVHEKGASKEKVISQKGVTDLFQPKGSYPTNTELSAELNKKIDKSNISQQLANDVNKVPSLDLVTKELGKKQASGNYADKSSSSSQDFNGPIYATNNVGAKAGERRIKFELTAGRPEITHTDGVNGWRGVVLPDKTGTLALMSDIEEAGKNYQLKGNYADKGSKSTQKFEGPLEVTGEVQSSSEDVRLALKTATNTPTIIVKYGKSGTWKTIVVPDKSGTMALAGESYTKLESDNRYSPKLPLLSFSGKESKIISPNNKILIFVNDDGATGGYDRDAQATVWGFDKRGFMTRGTVHFDRMSGVYSQSQVDVKLNGYQPKGNYADKSSSLNQDFNGPIYATNNVGAKAGERRIKFELTAGRPEITHTDGVNGWRGVVLPDKTGTLALMSDIEEATNIPVGSPIPWSLGTAPSGYLICNGQTFNKSTYPKLAIAYPAGKLPDLRGEFIRGIDGGRGVDSGRQMLSAQAGNSLLSTNMFNDDSPVAKEYQKKVDWIGSTGTNNQSGYGIWQQIEGANGNETRPRNIAFLYIVRAA
ncbi:phage variable tail fiber protein [Proteus vulgaris]|uniref:Phage variable tail fiber protein n=1 Tax=Proteus vulgaris TaxID=585 RepID=A0A379F8Y3_PROVU|nr:phage tail protein [Proteus vulgaris]SUC15892.1 phage variable tail fiber protein [Proteus vulgaris]